MRYEYHILQADSPINDEQLNDLAAEGWELVTIIQWRGAFYFYFKRLAD
jgi:hypothetical protein